MATKGVCCFPCADDCDVHPSYNTKSTLAFSIVGGLHPQTISKPVRVGTNPVRGLGWCNPLSGGLFSAPNGCLPLTDARNNAGPASLEPGGRDQTTCCYWMGIWPRGTEGDSAFYKLNRAWTETDAFSDSGNQVGTCGILLPWSKSVTNVLTASLAVAATRKIFDIQVSFCPTVSAYGVREWTVTCEIIYNVIERLRISYYTVLSLDCFEHVLMGVIPGNPPDCTNAYQVKVCDGCCQGRYTNTNCVINRTEYNGGNPTGPYVVSDLATEAPCDSHTPSSTYAQDFKNIRCRSQTRQIKIPRNCNLPDTLSFPFSSLTAGTDAGFGWQYQRLNNCFYDLDPYKTYAGTYSDATVYEPLTELWTVDLT